MDLFTIPATVLPKSAAQHNKETTMSKTLVGTKVSTTENKDGSVTTTTKIVYQDGSEKIHRRTCSPKKSKSMSHISLDEGTKLFPKDNRCLNGTSHHSRTSPGSGRSKSPRNTARSMAEILAELKQDLVSVLGKGHQDDAAFAAKTSRAIPCNITLIASQDDVTQAQEGDSARRKYNLPELPELQNDYGSLATSAFLQLLYENPKRVIADSGENLFNCQQCILEIQQRVKKCSSLQQANPVISSSRPLGPPALPKGEYAPFYLVPPKFKGTRRALLISVTKGETSKDLRGPPNDVMQVYHFLTKEAGFHSKHVTVLRDDSFASSDTQLSTKQNILRGFANLVSQSKSGDVAFIQFSGHGGRLENDLFILPTDHKQHGQIMDYEILRDLTKNLPPQVHATMLVDCCYSGCIGDLPYSLHSKECSQQEIETYFDTDTRQEMIQNEQSGGETYRKMRETRKQCRNITRIPTIAAACVKEKRAKLKSRARSLSPTPKPRISMPAPKRALSPIPRICKSGGDLTKLLQKKPTEDANSNRANAKWDTPKPLLWANSTEAKAVRTKTIEELAKEKEEEDRKAAVERSRKEAIQDRLKAKLQPKPALSPIPRRSGNDLARVALDQKDGRKANAKFPPRRAQSNVAKASASAETNAISSEKSNMAKANSSPNLALNEPLPAKQVATTKTTYESKDKSLTSKTQSPPILEGKGKGKVATPKSPKRTPAKAMPAATTTAKPDSTKPENFLNLSTPSSASASKAPAPLPQWTCQKCGFHENRGILCGMCGVSNPKKPNASHTNVVMKSNSSPSLLEEEELRTTKSNRETTTRKTIRRAKSNVAKAFGMTID